MGSSALDTDRTYLSVRRARPTCWRRTPSARTAQSSRGGRVCQASLTGKPYLDELVDLLCRLPSARRDCHRAPVLGRLQEPGNELDFVRPTALADGFQLALKVVKIPLNVLEAGSKAADSLKRADDIVAAVGGSAVRTVEEQGMRAFGVAGGKIDDLGVSVPRHSGDANLYRAASRKLGGALDQVVPTLVEQNTGVSTRSSTLTLSAWISVSPTPKPFCIPGTAERRTPKLREAGETQTALAASYLGGPAATASRRPRSGCAVGTSPSSAGVPYLPR
ncbi:hypothetical protein QF027_006938 [Streptomyces canus]|nr:hypothetical protein [Streptomyces canus]